MIAVVPYDAAWPGMFAAERDRLTASLGEVAVRIDHVGSTAVAGLAAKPWIDIQVEVRRMLPRDAYRDPLLALGYVHHPDDDDHEFFDRRPYHVHVCAAGGDWARRHLAFRDLLRRDPAARAAYQSEKLRLAAEHDDVLRLHGGQDADHSPSPGRFYPAAMTSRRRLDAELVERGLAETRSRAQALVMAGRVTVGGRMVDKAGTAVAGDADIAVSERPRYVSRGGDKLETGLRRWQVDVTGERCLDVGASTGGFTDCLLQHGAAEVVALDVGRGQLTSGCGRPVRARDRAHERARADRGRPALPARVHDGRRVVHLAAAGAAAGVAAPPRSGARSCW